MRSAPLRRRRQRRNVRTNERKYLIADTHARTHARGQHMRVGTGNIITMAYIIYIYLYVSVCECRRNMFLIKLNCTRCVSVNWCVVCAFFISTGREIDCVHQFALAKQTRERPHEPRDAVGLWVVGNISWFAFIMHTRIGCMGRTDQHARARMFASSRRTLAFLRRRVSLLA